MSFSITSKAAGSALALGATLYSLSVGFKGAKGVDLNPLVSLAFAVQRHGSVSLLVNPNPNPNPNPDPNPNPGVAPSRCSSTCSTCRAPSSRRSSVPSSPPSSAVRSAAQP